MVVLQFENMKISYIALNLSTYNVEYSLNKRYLIIGGVKFIT